MFIKKLYLDLDGVFADFTKRVTEIAGRPPHELHKGRMWAAVHSDKRFFANLDFMPGALVLWEGVKHLNPSFLTGAPSSQAFRDQKKEWVAAKFGDHHEVIVLPRREKKLYSGIGHVLIDDTGDLIDEWRSKGGIGIHYDGDPEKALVELDRAHRIGYNLI